jgi:hypothetical protein
MLPEALLILKEMSDAEFIITLMMNSDDRECTVEKGYSPVIDRTLNIMQQKVILYGWLYDVYHEINSCPCCGR